MKSWKASLLSAAALLLTITACGKEEPKRWAPTSAERLTENEIQVTLKFSQEEIDVSNFIVYGSDEVELTITEVEKVGAGKKVNLLVEPAMSMQMNYTVGVIGWNPYREAVTTNTVEAQWGDDFLNSFYSDKELGCLYENGQTVMRVFSPRATEVKLCLFKTPYDDEAGQDLQEGETQIEMIKDEDGVWEAYLDGTYWGQYYGYRVSGPEGSTEDFHPEYIVCDPYSAAITTHQSSPQYHLSVILNPDNYYTQKYDQPDLEQRELIIYEMHVRDLTMNSDVKNEGTYAGLMEEGKGAGMDHILDLGVNAVELLPIHELDEIEAPYDEVSDLFVNNTWNTYGRNHWGYMTTCWFAPESFYYEGSIEEDEWCGADGGQVNAFMKLVDAFHENGIAVIMDVVFNHVSQYDRNPLKYIDKKYYFLLNSSGAYESSSGCGNDFNTARPMTERLIADSCEYFVDTYNVDGYRFDLATMIDWDTFDRIQEQVYAVDEGSYLIAEPWGGGKYDLGGFDEIGMGAWNDMFRNVVRSAGNATAGRSTGLAYGNASVADMKKCVKGYPTTFDDPGNSINYIESHDNNTIGDYIRAADGSVDPDDTIVLPEDYLEVATLNETQMAQNKVIALFMMTCQGAVMIHEGQEFARMKIVYPPEGESVFPPFSANWDNSSGEWMDGEKEWSSKAEPYLMDHDSYEKDNEGNWLPWDLKDANIGLFDYYAGLIDIRKSYDAFTSYPVDNIEFIDAVGDDGGSVKTALGYIYEKADSGDDRSFVILVNANDDENATFTLPEGDWTVMVDADSTDASGSLSGDVTVEPYSGYILYQM